MIIFIRSARVFDVLLLLLNTQKTISCPADLWLNPAQKHAAELYLSYLYLCTLPKCALEYWGQTPDQNWGAYLSEGYAESKVPLHELKLFNFCNE